MDGILIMIIFSVMLTISSGFRFIHLLYKLQSLIFSRINPSVQNRTGHKTLKLQTYKLLLLSIKKKVSNSECDASPTQLFTNHSHLNIQSISQ